MNTIEKYHGLHYLQYIAYVASSRLGQPIGPFSEHISSILTKHNGISPYGLIIKSQTCGIVHKQSQHVS